MAINHIFWSGHDDNEDGKDQDESDENDDADDEDLQLMFQWKQ